MFVRGTGGPTRYFHTRTCDARWIDDGWRCRRGFIAGHIEDITSLSIGLCDTIGLPQCVTDHNIEFIGLVTRRTLIRIATPKGNPFKVFDTTRIEEGTRADTGTTGNVRFGRIGTGRADRIRFAQSHGIDDGRWCTFRTHTRGWCKGWQTRRCGFRCRWSQNGCGRGHRRHWNRRHRNDIRCGGRGNWNRRHRRNRHRNGSVGWSNRHRNRWHRNRRNGCGLGSGWSGHKPSGGYIGLTQEDRLITSTGTIFRSIATI
mmetsp:Transcript_15858/g.17781  ORF Transcript_15858/g.17781 Transcript_15858/m.17781 type:complete len:258 (-) Transcript_15858:320-1093(-)